MTTVTASITDRIIGTLQKGDYIGLFDLAAPDVLIDMNSPTWRFQAQGKNDVVAHFAAELEEAPGVIRVTQLRVRSDANPVVVESEHRCEGSDGEYLWRSVDIIQTADDRIVQLTQYCTGPWDPATIARQADEAPMVSW